MDLSQAREYASGAMPQVIEDLRTLVGHSSIAFPGFPEAPMKAIADDLLEMFRRAGVEGVRLLDLGEGAYPSIFAEIPGPEGSPVVTLYAHYDVQPAPEGQGWTTDPWTLTQKDDGRLYGRGAADDKSGVVAHLATLAAFDGKPPVTVRLVIEGEEETGSHIEAYVEEHPEDFRSDVFVVADSGNQKVGAPALTTGLRGDVSVTVTVKTIESALHSGLFGGAAPDALVAMIQLLGSMYDETGATIIEGLDSYQWDAPDLDEADFRTTAGVLEGVELSGSGHLASRLWSRPAATVIGIDAPPVAGASNIVIPQATARVSVRIVPGSDPASQLAAIEKHLRDHAPRGVQLEIGDVKQFGAWKASEGGPATRLAEQAMTEAFGAECATHGSGGSIPLVQVFLDTSPGSEAILWGAEDEEKARIHGPDESVDPKELEDLIVAQILLLSRLGEQQN